MHGLCNWLPQVHSADLVTWAGNGNQLTQLDVSSQIVRLRDGLDMAVAASTLPWISGLPFNQILYLFKSEWRYLLNIAEQTILSLCTLCLSVCISHTLSSDWSICATLSVFKHSLVTNARVSSS